MLRQAQLQSTPEIDDTAASVRPEFSSDTTSVASKKVNGVSRLTLGFGGLNDAPPRAGRANES
jgi:hypothetical protein